MYKNKGVLFSAYAKGRKMLLVEKQKLISELSECIKKAKPSDFKIFLVIFCNIFAILTITLLCRKLIKILKSKKITSLDNDKNTKINVPESENINSVLILVVTFIIPYCSIKSLFNCKTQEIINIFNKKLEKIIEESRS
jgi:nitrogen fixation/metabolism regulation signal transduction histidine kinase